MNCKELVELVTDYLEGKLLAVDAVRFEQHLSSCDGCTNYLEQMRRAIHVIGYVREETLALQQWQDLLKVFRDWKKS